MNLSPSNVFATLLPYLIWVGVVLVGILLLATVLGLATQKWLDRAEHADSTEPRDAGLAILPHDPDPGSGSTPGP